MYLAINNREELTACPRCNEILGNNLDCRMCTSYTKLGDISNVERAN